MVGIDAGHRDTLFGLVDSGEAPFLRRLVENGTRVKRAVTMFPSTTVACISTLYTGCWYNSHGITNNEWIDRFESPIRARSYIAGLKYSLESFDRRLFGLPSVLLPETNTGGAVNNDLQRPTIYEELTRAGKTSYTYFHYVGRGATRWIKPGRLDMLRYGMVEQFNFPYQFYERYMVPRVIKDIKKEMPDLLSIYFGGNDGHSHRHGVEGQREYMRDLIDPQLARLDAALKDICPGDDIYWAITADHGQTTMNDLSPVKCVRDKNFYGILVSSGFDRPGHGVSDDPELDSYNTITALGNGASIGFYLRHNKTGDWKIQPDFERDITRFINNLLRANAGHNFAAFHSPGCVDFILTRTDFNEPYRIFLNEPPFDGPGRLVELEEYFSGPGSDIYVRPIERLRAIDHPKGPDVILMLNYRDGFNVNDEEHPHPGQHGSLLADDSYVPMIYSGPGVRRDEIPDALNIDFSPTAASILGVDMPQADGKPLPIFG